MLPSYNLVLAHNAMDKSVALASNNRSVKACSRTSSTIGNMMWKVLRSHA